MKTTVKPLEGRNPELHKLIEEFLSASEALRDYINENDCQDVNKGPNYCSVHFGVKYAENSESKKFGTGESKRFTAGRCTNLFDAFEFVAHMSKDLMDKQPI
jgi:hypothetical protein